MRKCRGYYGFERVLDHTEVVNDPQRLANEYVVPMTFAGVDESRVVGNQVQSSATPGSVKGPPPELGIAWMHLRCARKAAIPPDRLRYSKVSCKSSGLNR